MAENIVDELTDLMQVPVDVEAPDGDPDEYGVQSYLAAETIKMRVVGGHKRVRDPEGQIQMSTVQAVSPGDNDFTRSHRFTLPTDWDPRQPPVIKVDRVTDESGSIVYERIFFK